MALSTKHRRNGPVIKSLGSFSVTGNDENVRVTISKKLDSAPFPNEPSRSLRAELVIPGDDSLPYLELHPVLDGDEVDVENQELMRMWESQVE
ncbi:hypothetical protein C5B90_06355 [Haloferax sp. Atlit-12N]|uniref:hypothetical protein n=1 Tax=Haloferax sp. Atlit-12N TaxID=2077203 RepID=UPI000E22FF7A|nr:hypothetical protein [Haloferax sp. Atlit-12N]RDZ65965.1 hypothetical protein C5B90_06355 [Haloferax sp. Atlit-12N]